MQIDEKILRVTAASVLTQLTYRGFSIVDCATRNKERQLARGKTTHVCFSSLCDEVQRSNYTFIRYKPELVLPEDLCIKWMRFCIQNKFLPEYIGDNPNRAFTLKINNIPPSLLFIYLCNLRNMREETDLIRGILHLVDCGMDPYIATVVASGSCVRNSNHHYFNSCCSYSCGSALSAPRNLGFAIALRRYLQNPARYDDRAWSHRNSHRFNSTPYIEKACKLEKRFKIPALLDQNLAEAVYAETDDLALACIEKYGQVVAA